MCLFFFGRGGGEGERGGVCGGGGGGCGDGGDLLVGVGRTTKCGVLSWMMCCFCWLCAWSVGGGVGVGVSDGDGEVSV